jgi:hypothetical protein
MPRPKLLRTQKCSPVVLTRPESQEAGNRPQAVLSLYLGQRYFLYNRRGNTTGVYFPNLAEGKLCEVRCAIPPRGS